MKIPIPEVDERFENKEDALAYIARLCSVIVEKARVMRPTPSIADILAYALAFIERVLVQSSTLAEIARKRKDYVTVCALVRVLADNIATLNLIYNCEDEEEKVLRHLLYVLDGVQARWMMLDTREMKYDGKIPKETFDALYQQVQGAKKNAKEGIDYCISTIKERPLYRLNHEQIDVLIDRKNWKYRVLEKPKNFYSWREMYGMLNIKEGEDVFSSFLSQYVHGLSISNIIINDKDDFDAPLSFAICLLGWLWNYLRKVYEPYLGSYTIEDVRKIFE